MNMKRTKLDIVQAMTALNCKLVDSAKSANILVAKGITRTEKFLSAIGLASHIVSVSWIKDCVSKKSLLRVYFLAFFLSPF